MIELTYDIREYMLKSYGNKLNYQISCPLLNNFVDNMDKVISGQNKAERASFLFGHAETMLPFTALLGLFKLPKPLSYKCYPRNTRKWKSARVACFASNISMLLYKCNDTKVPYRVKLLHNEQEMRIPECEDMYCPYDKFKRLYDEYLGGNCDFEQMCKLK